MRVVQRTGVMFAGARRGGACRGARACTCPHSTCHGAARPRTPLTSVSRLGLPLYYIAFRLSLTVPSLCWPALIMLAILLFTLAGHIAYKMDRRISAGPCPTLSYNDNITDRKSPNILNIAKFY